jgi:hypothetical protein
MDRVWYTKLYLLSRTNVWIGGKSLKFIFICGKVAQTLTRGENILTVELSENLEDYQETIPQNKRTKTV